ncbi:hypothetical protein NIES4075_67010 [Tolypothrix sp. NIES-4075]|uniref:eCIS core domain-containing protein n=1 Tax=Tolypothrix sp. NIES-4075 TaxID=2005459 RepID=UPI000B5C2AE9|nr:DUF4157 domain-containing protein [Tolypothrix sp. NIES-4075]GAX45680.1 hypothetical protein NIES4075_67010 [Tolypothrix sp. NIES-4075]
MRSPISIQSSPKSSPLVHSGLLQRKCACGNSAKLTGQCNECDRQKLTLQRQRSGQQEHTEVPEIVHEVLNFPGQPLDPATRTFMESRFGHDFSQVRVHTDAQAAVSAQAVDALAYTVKPNIVFGTGQYAPHTREGQRLLAHELTHILQQQSNALRPQAKLTISSPGDASEREADRMATIVSQQQSHRHFNPVKNKLQRRTIFEGIAGLFSGDSFKEEELQNYLTTLE